MTGFKIVGVDLELGISKREMSDILECYDNLVENERCCINEESRAVYGW